MKIEKIQAGQGLEFSLLEHGSNFQPTEDNFSLLESGERNIFHADPFKIEFTPVKLNESELNDPSLVPCYRVNSLDINDKTYNLADSPLLLTRRHSPVCRSKSFGMYISGDHSYEICLPWVPDSILRVLVFFHEWGHAKTLHAAGEPPSYPEEIMKKPEIIKPTSPKDLMRLIISGRIPPYSLDEISIVSEYFAQVNMLQLHKERLANQVAVREARSFFQSGSQEMNIVNKAILQLVSANMTSRFQKHVPYIHTSSPGSSTFLKIIDNDYIKSGGLDLKPVTNEQDVFDGVLLKTHEMIDGLVQPNQEEIQQWAIQKLVSESNGVKYLLANRKDDTDTHPVSIEKDSINIDPSLLRTGNIISINTTSTEENYVIRLIGNYIEHEGEELQGIELTNSEGVRVRTNISLKGKLDHQALVSLLALDSIAQSVAISFPDIDQHLLDQSRLELLEMYKAMYPPEYRV